LTHVAKYAVVAGAVATPLAISAPASYASTDGTGSAYALAATGVVPIGPISPVHVTTGQQPTRKSLVEVPPNPIIEASVLNAAAAPGYARASVADVRLIKARLAASLVTAKCTPNGGKSSLVKAFLNGKKLDVSAPPNTTIAVAPENVAAPHIVKVVINKQVDNPDGTLTVTAIEVTVSLGPAKTETISIASANCGSRPNEATPPSGPAAPPSAPSNEPPGTAPQPTPVTGDLPVTG
jgi:hypothetical protein